MNPRDSPRGLCGESPTAGRRARGENAESLNARGEVRPPTFKDSVKWGQAVRLLPQKSFLYSSGRGKSRARPEIDIRRNRDRGGLTGGRPTRRTSKLAQSFETVSKSASTRIAHTAASRSRSRSFTANFLPTNNRNARAISNFYFTSTGMYGSPRCLFTGMYTTHVCRKTIARCIQPPIRPACSAAILQRGIISNDGSGQGAHSDHLVGAHRRYFRLGYVYQVYP